MCLEIVAGSEKYGIHLPVGNKFAPKAIDKYSRLPLEYLYLLVSSVSPLINVSRVIIAPNQC